MVAGPVVAAQAPALVTPVVYLVAAGAVPEVAAVAAPEVAVVVAAVEVEMVPAPEAAVVLVFEKVEANDPPPHYQWHLLPPLCLLWP